MLLTLIYLDLHAKWKFGGFEKLIFLESAILEFKTKQKTICTRVYPKMNYISMCIFEILLPKVITLQYNPWIFLAVVAWKRLISL